MEAVASGGEVFPAAVGAVPWLTVAQMIEVDRAMVDDYGITLTQMMENAGRALASVARIRFLRGDARWRRVIVLVGSGGNGGGALVCARRLAAWGARVEIVVSGGDEGFSEVSRRQLAVARRLGLRVRGVDALPALTADERGFDLIIDGVTGYGLRGDPRGDVAHLIRWADGSAAPVLSLDAPSGLDLSAGLVRSPALHAAATVTLALPKEGLRASAAAAYIGALYLADIGVPPALYASAALSLEVGPIFALGDVVRLG